MAFSYSRLSSSRITLQEMAKMWIAVIATWFLCNSISGSVADDAPTRTVWLNRPDGQCGHADAWSRLMLWTCDPATPAQWFTFEADGTFRINGKCATPSAFTPGSAILLSDCAESSQDARTWRLLWNRQIIHVATGLAVTVLSGTPRTPLILEFNIFSPSQTWLIDTSVVPSKRLATITGMNSLCLRVSVNNTVFIGDCGGTTRPAWFIYHDGTIRPESNVNQCLSYTDTVNKRVVVTSCGIELTNERWILTDKGMILNEGINSAMDVEAWDPSRNRIIVYTPTGKLNQQWRINYQ